MNKKAIYITYFIIVLSLWVQLDLVDGKDDETASLSKVFEEMDENSNKQVTFDEVSTICHRQRVCFVCVDIGIGAVCLGVVFAFKCRFCSCVLSLILKNIISISQKCPFLTVVTNNTLKATTLCVTID